MTKSTNVSTVVRSLLLGVGVTILILLAGGVAALLDFTVVNPWLLLGVIAAMGAVTGGAAWRYWGKITRSANFYVNFPVHIVVFTIITSALFLSVNYFAADRSSLQEQSVAIERAYWKQRHQSHRVNRRLYTSGKPYKAYYLDITLPDGSAKSITVTKRVYDKARRVDSATVRIGRGALGLTIMDKNSLRIAPKAKYS